MDPWLIMYPHTNLNLILGKEFLRIATWHRTMIQRSPNGNQILNYPSRLRRNIFQALPIITSPSLSRECVTLSQPTPQKSYAPEQCQLTPCDQLNSPSVSPQQHHLPQQQ